VQNQQEKNMIATKLDCSKHIKSKWKGRRWLAILAGGLGSAALFFSGNAMAGETPICNVLFTDIRGVVTVNGVPTSGVEIEVFCCEDNHPIVCSPNSPTLSTELVGDISYASCPVANINYHVAFNSTPAGGNCASGCFPIPGLNFGDYCPLAVWLKFTFGNCSKIVPCCDVAAAYALCGQGVINVDIPCATPCPTCVDPAFGLGAAAGSSVLELGAASVSITGPPGGIIGDVSIAPHGKLSLTGSEYIAGAIRLGPGATFQNSSSGGIGPVSQNVDLSAQIAAAEAANLNNAALPCNQNFTTLDGKSVKTITGVSGVNVICVKDISLSGSQITLTGPPGAKFVFNITGKLVLTGGGAGPQIRVDASSGIQPSAVLYNLIGTGQDVAFSGGGGGVSCCAAIVDGTILAPYRKIALSPGLVNGEIISGKDISIVSGSSVRCPPCP
jgi:choice-of-anchor A domain-containing protein